MNSVQSKQPRARGRKRDESLTQEILGTTVQLLAQSGFRDLKIEDIAATVGTSKQAIYRRWPSKSALVADAIRVAIAAANPTVPNLGSVREDLVLLFRRLIAVLVGTPLGGAIRALVGEENDDRLTTCLREVDNDRRAVLANILRRAIARGEISADRDLDVDIDTLLGAIYYRLLVRRVEIQPDLADLIVNAWWKSSQLEDAGGSRTAEA